VKADGEHRSRLRFARRPGLRPAQRHGPRPEKRLEKRPERRSDVRAELHAEFHSVRFRVLATLLVFMGVGLFGSGAFTHAAQLSALNNRVNAELRLPAAQLEDLAKKGVPGSGGASYGSLDDLFTTFLRSGTPGGYESVMTTIRGGNTILPSVPQGTNLSSGPLIQRIWNMRAPGRTVLRDTTIDGRTVRLAITSVSLEGTQDEGLLVAANEIGKQRHLVFVSMWNYALASAATLLFAGVVGWMVIGRLLSPVRRLREATQATTFEDLTKRVEVPASTDDVAQLAKNFNHMLERLESGFENQSRFVHDASHELRTPMTIIRGYLELLNAGDPEDVGQTRDLLLDELDRMQSLVDELLILARSGRPDFVSPDWIEADDFLDDILNRIKVLGPRHWQLDAKPGGLIHADRRRLTQALEQLAANAVKHTSEADRISVGAAWEENDGGMAYGARAGAAKDFEIWVADTGTGIPADEHEHIFERFGKGHNSAGTEGSGLGLSIVKAIVEAHGGTVRLESAVGEGSRFVLSIPSGGGDGTEEKISDAETITAAPAAKPRLAGPASGPAVVASTVGTP
jgi:two-component system OmpR family sensor kinase